MKGQLTIIHTNGSVTSTEYDHMPAVGVFQAAVGGYIEPIPRFDMYDGKRCVVFGNEEGKVYGLPVNEAATQAWNDAVGSIVPDTLVGDVVVVTGDREFMEAL